VVSDPYATHPEDKNYYPTLTPGLYKEASTGRLFIYKPTFGVKNPIRHYAKVNSPYYPNVHRPLTEKRAVIEKQLTLEKYKKPEVIEDDSKVPTLQWLCLKAIQTRKCSTIICGEEYRTTIKNFRLIFEDSLAHRLGIEEYLWPIGSGIDDQRPQPCRYKGGNQIIKHSREGWYDTPPYITHYIGFRYQDWIEAGGLELWDKLNGPRFWVDLWSLSSSVPIQQVITTQGNYFLASGSKIITNRKGPLRLTKLSGWQPRESGSSIKRKP
jgi:hypothetical protein